MTYAVLTEDMEIIFSENTTLSQRIIDQFNRYNEISESKIDSIVESSEPESTQTTSKVTDALLSFINNLGKENG